MLVTFSPAIIIHAVRLDHAYPIAGAHLQLWDCPEVEGTWLCSAKVMYLLPSGSEQHEVLLFGSI